MIAAVLVLASLPGVKAQSVEESAIYEITIDYVFSNSSNYTAKNVVARIYLFDNWSGWTEQRVLGESIMLDDTPIHPKIHDEEDNRWVEVELGTLGARTSKTVHVTQVVKVKTVEFTIDPTLVGSGYPEELQEFVQPVPNLFQSDDPKIQTLAQELTENTQNPYLQAQQIFNFVVENITYETQTKAHSALWTLNEGRGDCDDFSALFVALARAAGIPAKVVSGYLFSENALIDHSVNTDYAGHAWAIFYVPGYDCWFPVDLTVPARIEELGEINGRPYMRGKAIGSFGDINFYHLVGAITSGKEVVQNNEIKWPGPGQASVTWSYTEPYNPNVTIDTGGTVTPVLLLDLETTAATQIKSDGSLDFTVRVKNRGTSDVSSVRVTLEYDPENFEAVNVENEKNTLKSGEEWESVLTLRVRDNAYGENHIVGVRATYTSDYEGVEKSYAASSEVLLSIPPKPPAIVLVDYQTLLLLIAIAVAVGAIAGAVARKR